MLPLYAHTWYEHMWCMFFHVESSAGTKMPFNKQIASARIAYSFLYPEFESPAGPAACRAAREWHARRMTQSRTCARRRNGQCVVLSCARATVNPSLSRPVDFPPILLWPRWRTRRVRPTRSQPRPRKRIIRSTRFITRTTSAGSPGGSRLRGACSRRPPTVSHQLDRANVWARSSTALGSPRSWRRANDPRVRFFLRDERIRCSFRTGCGDRVQKGVARTNGL